MKKHIEQSFQDAAGTLDSFLKDEENIKITEKVSQLIADVFKENKKILICGNGGSACDSMHFAEEFTGRFRKERRALPVISLTDPSHITCVGNDYGFDRIFSRGVEAFGKEGDILIALSTSGNSENVIKAVRAAEKLKMKTIALLGKDGGKLKGKCDYQFIISADTSDRVQEVHMTILHIVIEEVERLLF